MHIYDLAETWFAEYQSIVNKSNKSNHFPFKLESEKVGIKKRGKKEYAYLWAKKHNKSLIELSEHFNINAKGMGVWIKENNLVKLKHGASRKQTKTTRPRSEVTALCAKAYEEMKNNGLSQTQACLKYKVTSISLHRYIKNLK
jgi:hypothetical protein